MLTLVLQSLVTVLLVAFSFLALAVSRRMRGETAQQQAWLSTGVVFVAYSLNKAIQGFWGVPAFLAGEGDPLYESYLRATPVFNHSRTLLVFVLYGALAWVALRPPLRRPWPWLIGASLVAVTLGGAYGALEGSLTAVRHYPTTALVDIVGFAVLAVVLLGMLIRDTADRLLWCALATYGVTSLVGSLFLTAGAWADTPGAWSPPFWMLEAFRLVSAAGMVAFAVARYRATVRGIPVRGLLPRHEPLGRPTLA